MKKRLFVNYYSNKVFQRNIFSLAKVLYPTLYLCKQGEVRNNFINHTSLFSFSNTSKKSNLDLDKYIKETHVMFEHIYEKIDSLDLEIVDNIDLTEGVLSIKFKSNHSYVLNIQRPNLQIWLSSPLSGPQRFEFDQEKGIWCNIRNFKNLLDILNEEFNKIIKENNGKETISL